MSSELETLKIENESIKSRLEKAEASRDSLYNTLQEIRLTEMKWISRHTESEEQNAKLKEKNEELLSYLPKVPTQTYEKEMAKKILELEQDKSNLHIHLDASGRHVNELIEQKAKLEDELKAQKEAYEWLWKMRVQDEMERNK